MGRKCQLLRVDLTTSGEGNPEKLREHLKELLKRVKRKWGYEVLYFCVETSEGNGVLHMVWAIKAERAIWIPQSWISEEWKKIHNAEVVYIKRVSKGGGSAGRISKYFVSQYFAGQSTFVRISWSWGKLNFAIAKAWKIFNQSIWRYSDISTWCGLNESGIEISKQRRNEAWEKLLTVGSCVLANLVIFVSGKSIDVGVG
jgi:hypothetical protein